MLRGREDRGRPVLTTEDWRTQLLLIPEGAAGDIAGDRLAMCQPSSVPSTSGPTDHPKAALLLGPALLLWGLLSTACAL